MINLVHLVDRAVALNTRIAPVYVDRMIEINIVRNFVHLHPGDELRARLAYILTGSIRSAPARTS